jgi:ribosomal protein L37AE/L43A
MGLIWHGVCALCLKLKETHQINGVWICKGCQGKVN